MPTMKRRKPAIDDPAKPNGPPAHGAGGDTHAEAAGESRALRGSRVISRLKLKRKKGERPTKKALAARRTVALLPPLMVPSPIMWPLWLTLRVKGYRPRVFRYASYRRDIPENAKRLAAWMRGLGEEEIDVVSFSLGGILARWAANHHDVPRFGRVVMMGPPNHGAYLADLLDRKMGLLFPLIWGRCARQLRTGKKGLAARAGRFPAGTEVGVIAGGRGGTKGFNPLVPGDNDMTVGVEETVLPGLRDFTLVRLTHTLLPIAGRSRKLALRFLQTGRFRGRG